MPRVKKENSENTKNTKKTTTKRTTVKKTVSEKKNLEEVMLEKIEKLEEENKKLSALEERKLERQRQRELRKSISDDTQIMFFCADGNAEVTYECPNTHEKWVMRYGDTDWMTFSQLKTMKQMHKGMLENYLFIPIDVDDDRFTIDDVFKILGIENLYNDEMLFEDNIDYILNNLDYKTFTLVLNDFNTKYVKKIIDRSIELAVKNEFNDANKRAYIESLVGQEEMYMDAIKNSKL